LAGGYNNVVNENFRQMDRIPERIRVERIRPCLEKIVI
jgi:hypothetical protein